MDFFFLKVEMPDPSTEFKDAGVVETPGICLKKRLTDHFHDQQGFLALELNLGGLLFPTPILCLPLLLRI